MLQFEELRLRLEGRKKELDDLKQAIGYEGLRRKLDELEQQMEERTAERVRAALAQLQGWGTDCAGLTARAALASPDQWGIPLDKSRFARQKTQVAVEVSIVDS